VSFENVLSQLADEALLLDDRDQWPQRQLSLLAEAGVLGWVIPRQFGGSAVSELELTRGYERMAAACLTTTFILTQRNGACQRIAGSGNEAIKDRLLPDLATGRTFATVGISHLTTSRQHLQTPAVRCRIEGETIRLSGTVPWVTGAPFADWIVTGGTCEDGRQVLVALPREANGVTVGEHARLMALTASHTASIELEDVTLPVEYLLAGPVEGVMKQGQGGGAGSLTTSTLALGLCRRSLDLLEAQTEKRPDLAPTRDNFQAEFDELHADLYALASGDGGESPRRTTAAIRQRCNSLALRITQAVLAVVKGAGFVRGHPAELAVREAMFFLVWSCPQPIIEGVLTELSCREGF
jgi:alkylation response protein AidB-like acyl-CoA dehydrogenase